MTADAETVLVNDNVIDERLAEEDWRGVAAEENDDISAETGLRLAARSRRLLRSLLVPHRRAMLWTALFIVIEQVSFMAGPIIISVAIDTAVPSLIAGDGSVLAWCVIGYLCRGRDQRPVQGGVRPVLGADLPGRAARPTRSGVQPRTGPVHLVPRALHVRSGDLAIDQ